MSKSNNSDVDQGFTGKKIGSISSEAWEQYKSNFQYVPQTINDVCPSCGYCPHCGQRRWTYPRRHNFQDDIVWLNTQVNTAHGY